jgi:ribonuclease BN (tRNA processing enzyme)
MRLTVLGGSAAGPNPGQGCSGYLIESGDTEIVVDLGPGTLSELRKHVDFRKLDAVVLSHLHLDHCRELFALRFALAYNPVPPPRQLPLWLPPGGLRFLDRLAQVLAEPGKAEDYFSIFAAREYDPATPLTLGSLTVTFTPTVHYVPCWAMRISDGGQGDLLYTADTGPSSGLAEFAAGARVIVSEGTVSGQPEEPFAERGHLTPREAGTLARECGAQTLVLTHLWAENNQFASLLEAGDAFAGEILLATPGLRVSW